MTTTTTTRLYPWQLPAKIIARADNMGATILACAQDAYGRVYVVAMWQGVQPYVCWAWDGEGFCGGHYSRDEAGALASLRARTV